jgi:toxin-antitoxin system PIN domain toxin
MILIDANLLLYAVHEEVPQHDLARSWLERSLNELARVAMPWPSLMAFVRIGCNPRLFAEAPSITQAWEIVESWLDLDNVWVPHATPRHRQVLTSLLQDVDKPALVMDSHIAALAIEHGLVLCSSDGDFARFQRHGLRWNNPLVPD